MALQCQSVAAGPALGPTASTLASLLVAESRSEQNTDDKLKAYLTDIMQINARSLVLRKLDI